MTSALDRYRQAAPADTFLPTRNDILNLYLGGGFIIGSVNEIHGRPAHFKTRILTEEIVIAQSLDAWQIVFDREGRITHDAISSLGGDPDHDKLIYVGNDPYQLTIGRVFHLAHEMVHEIRRRDLEVVVKKLKAKKPPKKLLDAYRRRVGLLDSAKASDVVKALVGSRTVNRKKEEVWHTHLLLSEHRSLILMEIDSTTALAAVSEVVGDKPKAKNDDYFEQLIRTAEDSSNSLGQGAREWSVFFRTMSWMDDRVCMLVTSQLRKTGFGSGTVFDRAAQPSANDFYGRTRLNIKGMAGGKIHPHPKGGGLYLGSPESLTYDQRATVLGLKLWIDALKTSGAKVQGFKCPAFMLGATGTDRPNTVWEFLYHEGLITHQSAGRWKTDGLEGTTFTRNEFVTELYAKEIALWSEKIKTRIAEKLGTPNSV